MIIAFFENGRRQIPIVYSRRQVGRRVYGGQEAHLPLQGEHGGHDPADLRVVAARRSRRRWRSFNIPGSQTLAMPCSSAATGCSTPATTLLIIFFCYFYTDVTFQPVDVAENLKKQQAYIPDIRPGKQTADYIDHVMQRITLRRRDLRRGGVRRSRRSSASCSTSVPVRRHLADDRRGRRARHGQPDRGAPHHP